VASGFAALSLNAMRVPFGDQAGEKPLRRLDVGLAVLHPLEAQGSPDQLGAGLCGLSPLFGRRLAQCQQHDLRALSDELLGQGHAEIPHPADDVGGQEDTSERHGGGRTAARNTAERHGGGRTAARIRRSVTGRV
jgi:hypothetical protein